MTCKAVVNFGGTTYHCDMPLHAGGSHKPFAHANMDAEVVWCSHDEALDIVTPLPAEKTRRITKPVTEAEWDEWERQGRW